MSSSTALLAVVAAQVSIGVAAQEAQPRVATKAQYASCLDTQDSIDQRKETLSKREGEQKAMALKFQAADESFNAQIKRHTPKTKNELASYNLAVEKRNRAAKEFNESGKSLERDQDALNVSIFKFNEVCGSLLVPSDVKEEVEQQRKAQSEKQ